MSTTTISHSNNPLIAFFDPTTQGPDPRHRTLEQILSWSDYELEASHDYIQTLFPLPEGSMFNSRVALVRPEVFRAFKERSELRDQLLKAWKRMAVFYGLEVLESGQGKVDLIRSGNWNRAKRNWLTRFNHNHLRLTRIIRSLRVLSLPEYAEALNEFLQTDGEVVGIAGQKSRMYWQRAAERSLWLPPDEDDEEAEGVKWLRDV